MRNLKAGGNFTELVRQYSIGPGTENGGDIDYIAPGDMAKDLRIVAMNLKIGQYSETVETGNGYFIIMKTDEKHCRKKVKKIRVLIQNDSAPRIETEEATMQRIEIIPLRAYSQHDRDKGLGKKYLNIRLVFWLVYCVTSTGTYP